MSSEAIKPNQQPPEPRWLVDLNELQARDQAGEQVDVLQAFEAVVDDTELQQRLQTFYEGKSMEYYRSDRESIVRSRMAGKLFLDTVKEATALAPDMGTFGWRMSVLLSEDATGIKYYSFNNEHISKNYYHLGRHGQTVASMVALCGFRERQPELQDEAVKLWAEDLNALFEREGGIWRSSLWPLIQSARREIMRAAPAASKSERLQRGHETDEILELASDHITFREQPNSPKSLTKNIGLLFSDLELTAIHRLSTDNLMFLHSQLLDPDFEMPKQAHPIKQSLNAAVNFLDSLTELEPEISEGPVGKLDQKLQDMAEQPEGVGYGDIVELANLVTPLLKTTLQLDIESLDSSALEDYPKAVDRLLSFAMQMSGESLDGQEPEIKILFETSAACIRLLAFAGAEERLQRRVLSLGDLALRYPNLSAREQRDLAEKLQQRRSEATIQQTYRELRGLHRSRSHHNRFKPGYGVLT